MKKGKNPTCEDLIKTLENGLGEQLIFAFIQLAVGEKNAEKYKKLKYTLAELGDIEDMLDKQYPIGHIPQSTTLIPFGFYLGQVLKKTFENSQWIISKDKSEAHHLFEMTIKCELDKNGIGIIVYPFKRVNKYWKDRSDRLTSLVKMISFTTEISMDPDYWKHRADDDGWIRLINGEMLRVFKTDKDDLQFENAKGVFHDKKPDGTKN